MAVAFGPTSCSSGLVPKQALAQAKSSVRFCSKTLPSWWQKHRPSG